MITGDSPQVPTQRRQLSENFPVGGRLPHLYLQLTLEFGEYLFGTLT